MGKRKRSEATKFKSKEGGTLSKLLRQARVELKPGSHGSEELWMFS